jgi:RNA polymerase sigma-70 factor (ECF subfamily)
VENGGVWLIANRWNLETANMVDNKNPSALTSAELLQGHVSGNAEVTTELFNRYVDKLIRLARRHLAPRLARRIDAEDVVQSAYRSFFAAAGEGRFVLQRSGDLWRLLAGITLNKLYRQVERNTAKKRDVSKECGLTAEGSVSVRPEVLSREPTADEALALADEIELIMRGFEPLHRTVIELRLQGYLVEEIAAQTNRTQRTVLRVLERWKHKLSERAAELSGT